MSSLGHYFLVDESTRNLDAFISPLFDVAEKKYCLAFNDDFW